MKPVKPSRETDSANPGRLERLVRWLGSKTGWTVRMSMVGRNCRVRIKTNPMTWEKLLEEEKIWISMLIAEELNRHGIENAVGTTWRIESRKPRWT